MLSGLSLIAKMKLELEIVNLHWKVIRWMLRWWDNGSKGAPIGSYVLVVSGKRQEEAKKAQRRQLLQ